MSWKKKSILSMVVFILCLSWACGFPFDLVDVVSQGEEAPEAEGAIDPDQTTAVDVPTAERDVSAMAVVVDPAYKPIASAVVGTNELLTDRNGVAMGKIFANQAGWVPVRAPGYVTNYARSSRFRGAYDLYFVTLVPVGAGAYYDGTAEVGLWLGEEDIPRLQVDVPPGALKGEAMVLELTEIQPEEVRMDDAWADLGLDYTPLISFDISAYDMAGEEVNVEGDTPVTIQIPDEEHDVDDLVLQSFDLEEGRWVTQEDACSRLDEGTIQCEVAHFSLNSFLEKHLNPLDRSSKEADDFRNAYHDLGRLYKEAEKDGYLDDEEVEDLRGDLKDPLEEMAEAAKAFAEKNQNEAGKAMLLKAAETAVASGAEGAQALAHELLAEAQDLVAEMAENLAEDADCGNMYELSHVAEQAMLIGGSAQAQVEPLLDKIRDRFENCEVWQGTVRYTFFLLSDFPGLEGKSILNNGVSSWYEIHDVSFGVNPATGKLDGDDRVDLNMATASYLYRIGPGECGYDKHYMDLEGGGGYVWLTFEGNKKGKTFQIGPMVVKESQPVQLRIHTYGRFWGDTCALDEREFGSVPMFPYKSQLLDGFYGKPQPPSLQDMLDTGIRRVGIDMEKIRGSQEIGFSSGVNRPPIIPIDRGLITWNFIRVIEKEE